MIGEACLCIEVRCRDNLQDKLRLKCIFASTQPNYE